MSQERVVAVALLLVVGLTAVTADKQGSTALSFGNWLSMLKSEAPSKAAALSSAVSAHEYDGMEVHHACLEEVKQKNCLHSDTIFYFESELGCCGERSHEDELVLKPTTIGQCDFTSFFMDNEVEVAKDVLKYGRFFALCHFNEKADECHGEPFCDKMVLSVQGDLHYIRNAVVGSTPSLPETDGQRCYSRRTAGGNVTNFVPPSTHRGRSNKVTAKAVYEGSDYHHHKKALYKTSIATVRYGPFTVNSRLHSVKYEQGWFEYTQDYNEFVDPITEEQAGDAHVLDPYKFRLSFIKAASK